MGRQASINIEDVRSARDTLIAAQKPHGIIAIRRHIGRGSPQLIAKLLNQIDAESEPAGGNPRHAHSPDADPVSTVSLAWHDFSRKVEHMLTRPPHSTAAHSQLDENRVVGLERLIKQQQNQLERLETMNHNLGERLMQQQDLFDSWRHEQQAERQMLRHQLEQLTQLAGAKPAPKKRRKRGKQLDLYDDSKS